MEKREEKKNPFDLLKQSLAVLCEGIDGLCSELCLVVEENKQLTQRVCDLEKLNVGLSERLDKAELKAGIVKTATIAEGTLTNIPESESAGPHSEGCMCFACRHPEIAAAEEAALGEVNA